MPYPSQPPFEAGALLQPRQLQRWLDVNKVSKLTRTETYWILPAFSVDNNWLGYSQLVAAFNFTATNNFSLPTFEAPLSVPSQVVPLAATPPMTACPRLYNQLLHFNFTVFLLLSTTLLVMLQRH